MDCMFDGLRHTMSLLMLRVWMHRRFSMGSGGVIVPQLHVSSPLWSSGLSIWASILSVHQSHSRYVPMLRSLTRESMSCCIFNVHGHGVPIVFESGLPQTDCICETGMTESGASCPCKTLTLDPHLSDQHQQRLAHACKCLLY